jgi:23S rRNA pseudouridine2604 synthase
MRKRSSKISRDNTKKTNKKRNYDYKNNFERKSTEPSKKMILKNNKNKFKQFEPINTGEIRLNKHISDSGFCSRREADNYIAMGKVKVDGKVAGIGSKINSRSEVLVNNHLIEVVDNTVYIALNKPVGITCTTEHNVKDNIVDFVNYPERIFPIGRLDKESEGLILLTNDGDIVNKILRADNNHEKEYFVRVNKKINDEFVKKMSSGIPILGTKTKKCIVTKIDDFTFNIILVQGLNRQIRRMCEYLGYEVVALKRERIMNIDLSKLPIGKWRFLTEKEIKKIKDLSSESSK